MRIGRALAVIAALTAWGAAPAMAQLPPSPLDEALRQAAFETCPAFLQGRIRAADVPRESGGLRIVISGAAECSVEVDGADGVTAVAKLADDLAASRPDWKPIDLEGVDGRPVGGAAEFSRFFLADAEGPKPLLVMATGSAQAETGQVSLSLKTAKEAAALAEVARQAPADAAAQAAADRRPLTEAVRAAVFDLCPLVLTRRLKGSPQEARQLTEVQGTFGLLAVRADPAEGLVGLVDQDGCLVVVEGPKAVPAFAALLATFAAPGSGWKKAVPPTAAGWTDYDGALAKGLTVRARTGRSQGKMAILVTPAGAGAKR